MALLVPLRWRSEARQFAEDFRVATARWIADGSYSPEDVATAREEMRVIIDRAADAPDGDEQLGYWFDLWRRMAREAA